MTVSGLVNEELVQFVQEALTNWADGPMSTMIIQVAKSEDSFVVTVTTEWLEDIETLSSLTEPRNI